MWVALWAPGLSLSDSNGDGSSSNTGVFRSFTESPSLLLNIGCTPVGPMVGVELWGLDCTPSAVYSQVRGDGGLLQLLIMWNNSTSHFYSFSLPSTFVTALCIILSLKNIKWSLYLGLVYNLFSNPQYKILGSSFVHI